MTEAGWLIELPGQRPEWWTGFRGIGQPQFSPDANDALRFSRKIDAERALAWLITTRGITWREATALFVSEHLWQSDEPEAVLTNNLRHEQATGCPTWCGGCHCIEVLRLWEANSDHPNFDRAALDRQPPAKVDMSPAPPPAQEGLVQRVIDAESAMMRMGDGSRDAAFQHYANKYPIPMQPLPASEAPKCNGRCHGAFADAECPEHGVMQYLRSGEVT